MKAGRAVLYGPRRRTVHCLGSLILVLGGCSGAPTDVEGQAPPAVHNPHAEIRLTRIVSDDLGIVQVGGSPMVDYIIDSIGTGAAWLDYDGDGDADLYLAQGCTPESPFEGPPDRLLRNDGDPDGDGVPSFVDVTEESGLGDRLWSFGVAVGDYDGDGDPDIFLTNWGPNRLYRNEGNGTFTDIAEAAGVADERWGVTAEWGDLDRDGDLDLYVANYVEFDFSRYPARGEPKSTGVPCVWRNLEVYCGPRNLEPAIDAYYRNDGDPDGDGVPRLVESTRVAGFLTDEAYFSLSVRFFDADNDGDDDVYVANDSVQNCYFINLGNGKFEETAIFGGLAYNEQGLEQAGMGVAAGDFDRDGFLDLAVTNFSHDHDTLYRNEGGALFTDVSYPAGIGTPSFMTLGWGVSFVDLDSDGWEDLFISHGHVYPQVDERELGTSFRQPNGLFRNLGDGTFEELSERSGPGLSVVKSSRALLPIDIDHDGDLDLLLTNFNDTPDLLINETAPGNWFQVRLEGAGGNREGIGARVELHSGGSRQIREIRRNASFAASTLPIAHFGLGASAVVDRLEVRWPSGATSVLEEVEANRRLVIPEPAAARP
jgi:hypothetical protein